MMLTPKFHLSQDDVFLYLHIHIPHMKLTDADCHVEKDEFYFYSEPYYLRLHLPGNLVDNEHSRSVYNSDTGSLDVRVQKETRGQHFEGLDLLTKLLTPKRPGVSDVSKNIEVVSSTVNAGSGESTVEDSDFPESPEDEELNLCLETDDWFISQKVEEDNQSTHLLLPNFHYGFALSKTSPLNDLVSELTDMLDLKSPDSVQPSDRRTLRQQHEEVMFSCEHYLADLFDDEIIQELILQDLPQLTGTAGQEPEFDDLERENLMQLPRREYLIDDHTLPSTYLALVDLIFAYAYEFRVTHGEMNVESDWTMSKLSATLAWLDSFDTLQDVIVSCARRSLIFPLYRHWTLFERVFTDVKYIFAGGKSQILKCLLSIQTIFSKSEVRYPLNDIYITDYCVWIQNADVKRIKSLADALNKVTLSKDLVGLRIDEMEVDAHKVLVTEDECEETDISKLASAMDKVVNIKAGSDSDSDDTDDSEGSGSEDESDSSSTCSSSSDTSTDEEEEENTDGVSVSERNN